VVKFFYKRRKGVKNMGNKVEFDPNSTLEIFSDGKKADVGVEGMSLLETLHAESVGQARRGGISHATAANAGATDVAPINKNSTANASSGPVKKVDLGGDFDFEDDGAPIGTFGGPPNLDF
jgi:hypothetical protein